MTKYKKWEVRNPKQQFRIWFTDMEGRKLRVKKELTEVTETYDTGKKDADNNPIMATRVIGYVDPYDTNQCNICFPSEVVTVTEDPSTETTTDVDMGTGTMTEGTGDVSTEPKEVFIKSFVLELMLIF
jgi:hypothetical protein